MTQPITRQVHGILDYVFAAALVATPFVLSFALTLPAFVMWGFAVFETVVTLCTRAEWGLLKKIPYKTHLLLDAVGGVTLLALPWLLGFSGNVPALAAFSVFGLIALGAFALSKPEEMGEIRAA